MGFESPLKCLNLDKQFQRYLHFSALKRSFVLWAGVKGELNTSSGTKNIIFDCFL